MKSSYQTKGRYRNMGKNTTLLRKIFGEKALENVANAEKLDNNKELDTLLNDLILDMSEVEGELYYEVGKRLAEEDSHALIAAYLKENAEEIAVRLEAKALRRLRHPEFSRELKPYLEEK